MENEVKTNEGAFLSSLKRNNKQIRDDRAAAIGESAQLLYKRAVEDLEENVLVSESPYSNKIQKF